MLTLIWLYLRACVVCLCALDNQIFKTSEDGDEGSGLRAMLFGIEPHTGTGLMEALEWFEVSLKLMLLSLELTCFVKRNNCLKYQNNGACKKIKV